MHYWSALRYECPVDQCFGPGRIRIILAIRIGIQSMPLWIRIPFNQRFLFFFLRIGPHICDLAFEEHDMQALKIVKSIGFKRNKRLLRNAHALRAIFAENTSKASTKGKKN
jgi:hypothetical protein